MEGFRRSSLSSFTGTPKPFLIKKHLRSKDSGHTRSETNPVEKAKCSQMYFAATNRDGFGTPLQRDHALSLLPLLRRVFFGGASGVICPEQSDLKPQGNCEERESSDSDDDPKPETETFRSPPSRTRSQRDASIHASNSLMVQVPLVQRSTMTSRMLDLDELSRFRDANVTPALLIFCRSVNDFAIFSHCS
ncbi:hypothetical protein GYMLUDRAFT_58031 [Collybiopsis luxurians FD-317 M1]|uniref:Uncharacterized protein n=1 Tax=Collybiopsis luxurians FD-317 M1 TaxID=944289 RepID=A0A0D0CTI4_9AGAR|nr:hypothetical protein GYMLUDRAFT_58031 [Collybiopsis luxurians FD-317 M1]